MRMSFTVSLHLCSISPRRAAVLATDFSLLAGAVHVRIGAALALINHRTSSFYVGSMTAG
jgi:hypothetical protein